VGEVTEGGACDGRRRGTQWQLPPATSWGGSEVGEDGACGRRRGTLWGPPAATTTKWESRQPVMEEGAARWKKEGEPVVGTLWQPPPATINDDWR